MTVQKVCNGLIKLAKKLNGSIKECLWRTDKQIFLTISRRLFRRGSGADCKSVVSDSGGSTPPLPTNLAL